MAKESDVSGPQGGEHVDVGARAQYGAESDVLGVTIESLYALVHVGETDVVNQLDEILRQCTAIGQRMDTGKPSCVFNADSIDVKKIIESIQKSMQGVITETVKH